MALKNGRINTAIQIINVDLSVPPSIQLSSLVIVLETISNIILYNRNDII